MKHFSLPKRKNLHDLLQNGETYRDIRKILGFSISSISEEINRNGGRLKYGPFLAEKRAQEQKDNRQKRFKLERLPALKEFVITKLRQEWSPEQIAGDLRQKVGKTVICHETIYQFIYSEEGRKLKLWQHLRHRKQGQRISHGTRRKQKYKSQIPQRTHISLRSPAAQGRT